MRYIYLMDRKPTSFRLSTVALGELRRLADSQGLSKTKVVEIAIGQMARADIVFRKARQCGGLIYNFTEVGDWDKDSQINGLDDSLLEGEPSIPNRSPLSPCPFCGAHNSSLRVKPVLIVDGIMDDVQIVSCANCGANGPRGKTSVESITRWNTAAISRNKKK